MIKVQSLVGQTEVLEALNQQPPNCAVYVAFVQAYWRGTSPDGASSEEVLFGATLHEWADRENQHGSAPFVTNYLSHAPYFAPPAAGPEQGWSLPDTISMEERQVIGEALTSAHLRGLVDGWLDTGREKNGSEQVSRRDVRKTPEGFNGLSEFLDQCRPRLNLIDPHGFVLLLAQPEWSEPWAADFFEAQRVRAKRLFVGIMASDWNQQLCKCRYHLCGRYFVGARPDHCYRHGTFCTREHRSRECAETLTRRRRVEEKRTLVDAAAQWLIHERVTQLDEVKLKGRLAKHLTKLIQRMWNLRRSREPVTTKWVTRNCLAIQHRVTVLKGRS